MKRNITLLKIYVVFQQPLFFLGVVYPYYLARDINIGEFFLVTACWSLGALLFELPAGYISDRYSRRAVLIVSALIGFAHYAVMYFSHGVLLFGIADFLGGFSYAFMSGTDSALLYESLEEEKKQADYARHDGQMRAYALYALAGSVVLGGFLYAGWSQLPVALAAASKIVSLICAFYLIEPARHTRHVYQKLSWVRLRTLFSDYRLLAFFILSAVLFEVTFSVADWVKITYFTLVGVPDAAYGVLVAFYLAFHALGNHTGPHFWCKAGWRGFVVILMAFMTLTLMPPALFISPWCLLFLTGVLFTWGLSQPVLRQKINDAAPPEFRASTFSLKAFLEHSTAMCGFLLMAGVIENNIQTAFFGFWMVLVLVCFFWLFLYRTPLPRGTVPRSL